MTAPLAGGAVRPREPADADVDRAIGQAKRFLYAQQLKTGLWAHYRSAHWQGVTALACFALLEAGEDPQDPRLAKALEELGKIEYDNLYFRAVRAMAYSQAVATTKDSPYRAKLEADVKWLTTGAQKQRGAWGYRGPERYGDNSCSQFALLALWEADRAGVKINPGLIRLVERTWLTRQRSDGGWIYPGQPNVQADATLTMTTAGLASLFVCRDVLTTRCAPNPHQEAQDKALAWMAKRLEPNYISNMYLAFCVQRVGMAGGLKFIGDVDWYAAGANVLCRPSPYGRSYRGQWGPIVRAAFELIFLARGRIPLTINKLRYGSDSGWNFHVRDVPRFTEFMRRNFERRMRWQVVDIAENVQLLLDAPIMLVTGTGKLDFTDEQWAKLREYTLRGGLLLMVPAHSRKDFATSAKQGLEQLYAAQRKAAGGYYTFEQLPGDHPVYTLHTKIPNGPKIAPMWGVSDGTRLLALFCERDVPCQWQKGRPDKISLDYMIGVNMFLYAVGSNQLATRMRPVFVGTGRKVSQTAKVAWLKHDGNWNTQPYALNYVSQKLTAENRVALEIDAGVPIDSRKLAGHQIAWMTGTSAFSLSDSQKGALGDFLDAGGSLVVNAVGGSRAFNRSARGLLSELSSGRKMKIGFVGSDSPIMTGKAGDFRGAPLERLERTKAWRMIEPSPGPPVRVYLDAGGGTIMYVPFGMHDTLDGHTAYKALSYMPATSLNLAANIILFALTRTPTPQ